jgi:TolA-binding protein
VEDIIIFMIPIVSVLTIGAVITAFSPLGRGLAQRLSRSYGAEDEELLRVIHEQSARLAVAEDQIHSLRERIHFTEKLLQGRPSDTARLSPGGGGDSPQG